MLLDFNTPKTPNDQKPTVEALTELVRPPAHDQKPEKLMSAFILLSVSGVLSLSSLVLSLITIKNIPKPEPVSITCDPDLLKKIENQATVLSEIAESAKK